MLAESTLTRVAPVAGIAITHELMDGIELERTGTVDWRGTRESGQPLVIRHEVGDVRTHRMTRTLDVPPWCTFHMDERGEPSSRFHAVFAALTPAQQIELLTPRQQDPFFRMIKDMTVEGYYSSQAGLSQELGWHGNTFLTEFKGCTHPEHQK